LTQRLPRLIGVAAALDLMLSERPIPARGARALGLVDHAFGPRPAKTELWSFVADLQDRPRSPDRAKGKRGLWSRLRESPPFVRRTAIRPYREAFRRPDEQALIRAVERGWFSGKAQGEAAERAAFLAFANNPGCRERRDHARRAEAFADDCRNAPRPRRWGIVGMGPAAIELGLLLLRSGYAVSFAEPNAGVREIGTRQFDLGLQQCVSGGWLNVVEAGQKRKAVAVLADEWQLNSADVLVSAGSPLDSWAVRCRPGPHSDSPKRVVTLRFDGLPLAAQTVEIRSDEGAADFAAGLAAAVTLCGKRVVRPVESRALEFAA
jgi:3-hydroxyacyl-CoA dehydrogenase